MKFSIIMPTYNDAESIKYTLDSILEQTYDNYEVIIVDDGSSDNTKELIKNYIKEHTAENKIKYFYQNNADQLNAIKTGVKYITGDIVYILHSDDMFNNNKVLEQACAEFTKNKNIDVVIADLVLMNEQNEIIGLQKVRKYKNNKKIIPFMLLMLGRNQYVDFAFIKKDKFLTTYKHNYLDWNGPFWLDVDNKTIMNVKKVNFPFIKYRVFAGNYINNETGLLNVLNGELRVVCSLWKFYEIPFFKVQYYLHQLLAKIKIDYMPIYKSKETKNKLEILEFIYKKRLNNKEYPYYQSLLKFYKNYQDRTLYIDSLPKIIYYGSDMRFFNKGLLSKSLDNWYYNFFKEMDVGFNKIVVKKDIYENIKFILKFLCIDKFVKVEVLEK